MSTENKTLISFGDMMHQAFILLKEQTHLQLRFLSWFLLRFTGLVLAFGFLVGGVTLAMGTVNTVVSIIFASVIFFLFLGTLIYLLYRYTTVLIYTMFSDGVLQSYEFYLEKSKQLWKGTFLKSIIVRLVISGGTLLLIIPGIIFTVMYGFAIPSYITNADKYSTVRLALLRSKELTYGLKWKLFWRTTLLTIIVCSIIFVPGAVLWFFVNQWIAIVVGVVLAIISFFYLIAVHAVLYKSISSTHIDSGCQVTKKHIILFSVLGFVYIIMSVFLNNYTNIQNELDTQKLTSYYPSEPVSGLLDGCSWEQYTPAHTSIVLWRMDCGIQQLSDVEYGTDIVLQEDLLGICLTYFDRQSEEYQPGCVISQYDFSDSAAETPLSLVGSNRIMEHILSDFENPEYCQIQKVDSNQEHKQRYTITLSELGKSLPQIEETVCDGLLSDQYSLSYFEFDDRAITENSARYIIVSVPKGFDVLFDVDSIAF